MPSLLIYYAPLRAVAFDDSFILLHVRLPLRFSNCQGRLQVVNQLVYPVELFLYAERARCYVVAILFAMATRIGDVVGLTRAQDKSLQRRRAHCSMDSPVPEAPCSYLYPFLVTDSTIFHTLTMISCRLGGDGPTDTNE